MSEQAAVPEPREQCDHMCLKDAEHVDRGEPHFYGYRLPSPVARLAEAEDILREVLCDVAIAAYVRNVPIHGSVVDRIVAFLPALAPPDPNGEETPDA